MTEFRSVDDEISIEYNNVLTWGVCYSKRPGYTVPISLGRDNSHLIISLTKRYNTENPMYGKYGTVYFNVSNLSSKQRDELLGVGRCCVDITVKLIGINITLMGRKHLVFRVTKLQRTSEEED